MSTIKRSLLVLSLGVLLLPTQIKPLTVPRKTMIRGGVISTAAAFAAYATYAYMTKKQEKPVVRWVSASVMDSILEALDEKNIDERKTSKAKKK